MLKQIVALSFSLVITSHLMAQSTAPQAHYETIFMEIAPQKRVCHGIGVTECLQYKKFVFDENGQIIFVEKTFKEQVWQENGKQYFLYQLKNV